MMILFPPLVKNIKSTRKKIGDKTMFVAINYITCMPDYIERFESLFKTRVHAIDTMPGFIRMEVLKPHNPGIEAPYLVVSHWENEAAFRGWAESESFRKGHARGFADLKEAQAEGKPRPMNSRFVTYEVLTE